jgi:hypothetical protein
MVSLTVLFQVRYRTRSEWTVKHHHFEGQNGESLQTIDDGLVVIPES